MYQASLEGLDRSLVAKLAGLAYPGAHTEILALLHRIDHGEPLTI